MKNFTFSRYTMYHTFNRWWKFYLDSYEGGEDYLEARYLFRHAKESEDGFLDRIRRSYYYNFCRTVVDTYVSQLFRNPNAIYRDLQHPEYRKLVENADMLGNDMTTFMREQAAPAAQIFGHVHILVDKPKSDIEPTSRAELVHHGIRPYLTLIYPQNVVDYGVDRRGEFTWVRIEESGETEQDPFYDPEAYQPGQFFYRTWTRDGWTLHNDRADLVDSGGHNLGRVPLVTLYNIESKKYQRCGISALSDIAPVNRSIYNWSSLNDEFLYRQCFNILAIPQMNAVRKIKIGAGNALTFPADSSKVPFYLYPPVEPGEYLLKNINSAIEQIYRLAMIGNLLSVGSKKSQSGIAKAYDFKQANQNLVKKSKNIEQAEIEIAKVWALWEGIDNFTPMIEYPADFNIDGFASELKAELDMLKQNISQKFNTTIKKRIVSRYMKHDNAEREQIFAEIEGPGKG